MQNYILKNEKHQIVVINYLCKMLVIRITFGKTDNANMLQIIP